MAARCWYCQQTDHLGIDCPQRDPKRFARYLQQDYNTIMWRLKQTIREDVIMDMIHGPQEDSSGKSD